MGVFQVQTGWFQFPIQDGWTPAFSSPELSWPKKPSATRPLETNSERASESRYVMDTRLQFLIYKVDMFL